MRRTLSNAGRAGLVLLVTGLPAAAVQPEPLPVVTVLVDNAKIIRLPERTATVIIGNPIIADVTLQKNGVLVLTGKSFGSTNLIALDNGGAMMAETTIRVEASRDSTITVQRGVDRETLSCTPNCQPAVQLGDEAKYFDTRSSQFDSRRKLATGGGTTAAPPPAADH